MLRKGFVCLFTVFMFVLMFCSACGKLEPDSSTDLTTSPQGSDGSTTSSSTDNQGNDPTGTSMTDNLGGTSMATTSKTNSPTATETVRISIAEYEYMGDDNDVLGYAFEKISNSTMSNTIQGKTVNYILELKKKAYKLTSSLQIQGCSNLTVEGNGASIIMNADEAALVIRNCNNVCFKNLSVDYDPLPFTQGVIKSVSGLTYTVQIDAGYRTDNFIKDSLGTVYANLHDAKTGAFLENSSCDYAVSKFVTSSGGTIKVTLSAVNGVGKVPEVGDVISIYQRGYYGDWYSRI